MSNKYNTERYVENAQLFKESSKHKVTAVIADNMWGALHFKSSNSTSRYLDDLLNIDKNFFLAWLIIFTLQNFS